MGGGATPPLPIALLIAIWIGISPQGYDVRSRGVRSENTLDLNRNERAGRDANERKVGVATGQDPQVARIAHIQNAAGVGGANINLVRNSSSTGDSVVKGNLRSASDTGHASNTRADNDRRANQAHDRREVLSAFNDGARSRRNLTHSAIDGGTADSRDVDEVVRDDGDARADLKLLICHYLPNGN